MLDGRKLAVSSRSLVRVTVAAIATAPPAPDRVIGELHRQFRQPGRLPGHLSLVQGSQLPGEHPERPPVEDRVVDGHD